MIGMDQIWLYLQDPYVIMAINGLIAGWLAGQLLGGGGLIRNLIVGLIGAFIGGALIQMGLLKLPFTTGLAMGDQIIVFTIGAIIVVLIARIIAR